MKRIISAVLLLVILIPSVFVNAEESTSFYNINFNVGDGIIRKKGVIKGDEIYLPAADFADITRYDCDEDGRLFLVKGQKLEKSFKSVLVIPNKKELRINASCVVKLADCFEIDGELYLPLCQMLPVLNAEIYEVKENTICISNNPLSLAEVLYDFDIADVYFDLSSEFMDNDIWAICFTMPSYILNTITDFRYDRLDVFGKSGEYKDYKDIFSEFMVDNDLYLKAEAEQASILDETVDFFKKTNESAEYMKSAYDWIEAAGESKIDSKTGGVLLESLKAYYDSGELKYDDLKGLNDAWTRGNISFADGLETVMYIYTYLTQVHDNREMLDAVYDVNTSISLKEPDRRAAKQIYNLYGEKVIPAAAQEITDKCIGEVAERLAKPIAVYTATAKVAGLVLEAVMPFSASDISKLPFCSDVAQDASSKFYDYDTSTDESTEDLRLSLLLCLTASKKCFSILDNVSKSIDSKEKYYENKIDKIEKLIIALYMVSDNQKLDSYEHYKEYNEDNLEKIKPIISASVDYKIDKEDALQIAKDLISSYETYMYTGIACDVDSEEVLTEKEYEKIVSVMTQHQRENLDEIFKCTCCKSYEEAVFHTKQRIDVSLLDDISKEYVVYEDDLYFLMLGGKGGISYKNIQLDKFNNETITVLADQHNFGGEYLETQRFTIKNGGGHYTITKIDKYTVNADNVGKNSVYVDLLWTDISRSLRFCLEPLGDEETYTWKNNTICDSKNRIVAIMEGEKGNCRLVFVKTDLQCAVSVEDVNWTPDSDTTNPLAGVEAKVTVKKGSDTISSGELELYRSYTGYWSGGVCNIENGEVKDYHPSWMDADASWMY